MRVGSSLKTFRMQHPDFLLFQVLHAPKGIPHMPKVVGVQRDSHGVNRKITPIEIFLQAGRLNHWQSSRFRIAFAPGRGDIDVLSVGRQLESMKVMNCS